MDNNMYPAGLCTGLGDAATLAGPLSLLRLCLDLQAELETGSPASAHRAAAVHCNTR